MIVVHNNIVYSFPLPLFFLFAASTEENQCPTNIRKSIVHSCKGLLLCIAISF